MASPVLQDLIDEMTNAETVEDSAIAFIQGVPALIQAAVDAALANGATAEELAPVAQVGTDLKAKSDALAAALQPPPP
jgi:Tfp pilus assembly protein PilW